MLTFDMCTVSSLVSMNEKMHKNARKNPLKILCRIKFLGRNENTSRVCMSGNELMRIIYKRMHEDLASNDIIQIFFSSNMQKN